jgi:hypothetical protein
VIVVVEGPSASGKTTWIRRHCQSSNIVEETTTAVAAAAPEDPEGSAEFWSWTNSERWQHAQSVAASTGIAVCDSDPFKLHYAWTMWRSGQTGRDYWDAALEASRKAFASGSLGIADLFLVAIPDSETLKRQRMGDASRRRHNFEAHAQLAGPLEEWYRAIEQLDVGRVIWHHPADGLPDAVDARRPNTGTDLLDALLDRLESY